jgi:branched-chain amino acid transport system permease protein
MFLSPSLLKKALFVLFVLVLLAVPFFIRSDYLLTVLIAALYGAYICVCWNLAAGYTGLFSLGHQAFLGLGAYTSTILYLKYKITPWIGMFGGGMIAAVFAAFITYICYRYRVKGMFFAVATLAFGFLLQALFMTWDYVNASTGIWLTLQNKPADFFFMARTPYYWIISTMLIISLLITYFIERSRLGYYMVAVREDEDVAESLGVNSSQCKVIVMILSAFLTALGGTFYAQFYLYISPAFILGIEPLIIMQVGALVGGSGTLFGPVIGWAFFSFLGEFLRGLPLGGTAVGVISRIIWGLSLLIVIILLPTGMIGLGRKLMGLLSFTRQKEPTQEIGSEISPSHFTKNAKKED